MFIGVHTISLLIYIAGITIQGMGTSDSETSLIPNGTIAPVGARSVGGLSPGAVVGLIIGLLFSLVLGVAIVAVVVALVLMKHKQTNGKYTTKKDHALGIAVVHTMKFSTFTKSTQLDPTCKPHAIIFKGSIIITVCDTKVV